MNPGPVAQDHNGTIFLDTPMHHANAIDACQKLNEGLLATSGLYFTSDTSKLAKYLQYDRKISSDQRIWVAGKHDADCKAYSLDKGVKSADCTLRLPTFCAQSAPHRNYLNTDPNPAFNVQVQSGQTTFIG